MVRLPRIPSLPAAAEDADSALFRNAVAGVRPRQAAAHVPARPGIPAPHPRSRQADEQDVMRELLYGPFDADLADCVETLQYRGPGLQDRVWRRLVRGTYCIEAELDLHGLNREGAYRAVASFIEDCRSCDRRCVRIIHGKGLRSSGRGPVIRTLLGGWLRRRHDVLAFCQARPQHGGSGASYVLLRAAAAAPHS